MEFAIASLGRSIDIECDAWVRQWYDECRTTWTDYDEAQVNFLRHPNIWERIFGPRLYDTLDEDEIHDIVHFVLLDRELLFLDRLDAVYEGHAI